MADDYGLYSGINENMTGNIKFIMRTEEAIKAENKKSSKVENKKTVKTDDEGFFSKLLAKFKNL